MDGTSKPSFLEALAARFAQRTGGGSGVDGGATEGAPRAFRVSTSTGHRPYGGAPAGRPKGCACSGKRPVPGVRKAR